MRATTEGALLEAICRIVVDDGGYRFAWVGLVEDDEAKTVRPVTQCGFEAGYLESVNITWADTERGRGPTGTAIRTGQHVIARNIPTDPSFGPWRVAALQHGYGSSIALPLKTGDRVIGALSIYAAESDAFNAKEVSLLTALADDVAYGITALRTRAEWERTEEALRHRGAQLAAAEVVARMGSWEYDVATDTAAWSDNMFAIFDVDPTRPDELVFKTFVENLVHPDDRTRIVESLRAAMAGGPPYDLEYRIRRRDGTERVIDARAEIEWAAAGEPRRLIGIVQDITERKMAEEAVKRSEALYHDLVETSQDLIWQCDADGRYTYLNSAWEQTFGYKIEEMLGKRFTDFQTPEYAEQDLKEFARLLKGNTVQGLETVHIGKDGRKIDLIFNAKFLVDELGNAAGTRGTAYDITARKVAEEALRRSEEVLRLFVEHSPAAIAMFDREMKYIAASRRYLIDYDLREQNLAGRSHYDVFPEVPDRWKDIHRRCLAGAIEKADEDPFPRADGRLDWVRWEIRPWNESDGGIGGVILFSEVITERKQAEEEVRRLNVELEQRVLDRTAQLAAKNEELKGFAYTVSHDLKAPLRGIAGYAQELERRHKEGLGERAQFCITQVITASRTLDTLIEDLLTYSRLESETPTASQVNLADLVQSILRDRSLALIELGVAVSVNIPPLTLHAWERGLHQVLTNLIDNAVKYSRQSKPPRLTVTAEALPGAVRVIVADNGIGFDMKYHDRIFGLFNRLVRAEQFEGTGAGLAIVKKLVEKLGGTVRAESAPGQGATFFVELPHQPTTDITP
ncbi:MAG: PAS domain S-box protein [Acidobacteria bacterium]|nr:PAS domain S-box protein [Acidobacteriota bacterium]